MQMRTLTLGLSILFAGACNKAADEGDTGGTIDFNDIDDTDGDDGGSDDGDDGDDDGSDDDGGDDGSDDDGGDDGSDDDGGDDGSDDGGDDDGGDNGGTTAGSDDGGTGTDDGGETGSSDDGGEDDAVEEPPDADPPVGAGLPDADDDRDGYSEEEGDCNDTDDEIFPGADEDCDGIDTNCDGYRDLEFWDPYEPNDDFDMVADLGDIDSWTLGDSDITISGLNFDYAEDEDWFLWNANDTWYDDPDISIQIEADDLMNLHVTLYALRSSDEGDVTALEILVEKDVVGEDSIFIDESDFPSEASTGWLDWIVDTFTGLFDGSDDYFYLQIETDSTWEYGDCTGAQYDLTITS